MVRITRALVVTLAVLGGGRACAQTGGLPAPQVATPAYAQPRAGSQAQPIFGDAHDAHDAACSPNEDNNGTTLFNDPLLMGRQTAESVFENGPITSGWFASLEASLVTAHITQQMFAYVGPFTAPSGAGQLTTGTGFHIDNADLAWTVSPVFQFGYRFEQGLGEIMFTYQYLNDAGSQGGVNAFGAPASISTHLSVNSFDLTYGSREFSLGPWCDMKWLVGFRAANVFFDTQASNSALSQSLSNNYLGFGPVAGLNVGKTFAGTGLDVFCRMECGLLFGPNTQIFDAGGGAILNQGHSNTIFVPKVEAGIGWSPPACERLHFAAGYVLQYWSNLEEQTPTSGPYSRGDLTIQGAFFRGEWNF